MKLLPNAGSVSESDYMSAAIIGAGWAANEFHAPYYDECDNICITAIVDHDQEKRNELANEYNVKNKYSTTEELLQDLSVDIVSICTPPSTHEEIIIQCLEYGCHVFCEKPLTTSLESANRIAQIYSGDNILFTGYTPKFYENYKIVKSIIDNGLLGEIYSLKSIYYSPDPPNKWYFDPEISGGGVIADKLPHLLDYYLDVLGEFKSIEDSKIYYRTKTPYRGEIQIKFNKASVEFIIGWGHPQFYSKQVIVGQHGQIEFNNKMIQGRIRGRPFNYKYGETPLIDLRIKQIYLSRSDDGYENRMRAFFESVSQGMNTAHTDLDKSIDIWEIIEEIK